MGYTTDFRGEFSLDRPLDKETHAYLTALNETRRMQRNLGPEFGVNGELYVGSTNDFGQDRTPDVTDYNSPPRPELSLWCGWRPNEEGTAIEWDGGEKFYSYVEWLRWIVEHVLSPKGYLLNGSVQWRGEDWDDTGTIVVLNNIIGAA